MNSPMIFALAAILVLLGVGLLWMSRSSGGSDEDAGVASDATEHDDDATTGEHARTGDDTSTGSSPADGSPSASVRTTVADTSVTHTSMADEEAPSERRPEPPAERPSPRPDAQEEASRGFGFGVRNRRERREWAKTNGYDFSKKDDYLVDEWSEGSVTIPSPARDVVSGSFRSREFHVADAGERTLMAMRRPVASSVELDIRPEGQPRPRTDCEPVASIHGWDVASTDAASATRMVDTRVERALAHMPASVSAVWMQSRWVIAELTGSTPADWEELRIRLGDLSDAAMTLPPETPQLYTLGDDEHDPTRAEVPPILIRGREPSREDHPQPGPHPAETVSPTVEFPTRTQQQSHGSVGDRSLGVDEVEPIADESVTGQAPTFDGTTVIRPLSESATIFDDISAELGTNPLSAEGGAEADTADDATSVEEPGRG